MTFWPPLAVRGFITQAGFARADADQATALAMCASDGADHYQWKPDDVPGVDQRGLFAIDVCRVGEDDAGMLYHPAPNAEWAFALWNHYVKSWEWSPVFT